MADVLARIVARKREEVATCARQSSHLEPTHRSLRAALARPGARFIMETKQRSPSGHVARHSLDQAVAAYAPVADAISVLTDETDFGGSLDDLRRARALFDGPILAKDFVVDPVQVGEARAAGADAVLVMLSVLDDAEAARVMGAAGRLGMDALVEVHDEAELARALALGATLVGINNRDLKTLRTDLAVTERLAPAVPPDVVLVSESGIGDRGDVERLAPLVDAFLVGSSLMRAERIGEAARALVHGRVKICGLTRYEDIALAAENGATHAGFIFVPGTPRALVSDEAAPLARQAKTLGLRTVGVFRDADAATIAAAAAMVPLDAIQLHGNEDEQMVERLRGLLGDTEIVTARAIEGGKIMPARGGDRTLFDSAASGVSGGTGAAFDWTLLSHDPGLPNAFLAGGIAPENAAAAAKVGAYALDLSSGVEVAPGVKDPAKVRALFEALRPVCRSAA